MNKVFDILPSLSNEQKEKKASGAKEVDNFTVKKCPLMDNFENMDPTTMWKPLIGAPIQPDAKQNSVNAKIVAHVGDKKSGKESMFVLTDSSNNVVVDSSNNVVKPAHKSILPKIQGITHRPDADSDDEGDDDDSIQVKVLNLDTVTKVYVGALSLVGLFVLYRVVKKTM
jgi:hypothetical protein